MLRILMQPVLAVNITASLAAVLPTLSQPVVIGQLVQDTAAGLAAAAQTTGRRKTEEVLRLAVAAAVAAAQ